MFRFYQKALRELEESSDEDVAVGEIEEHLHKQVENSEHSVNNTGEGEDKRDKRHKMSDKQEDLSTETKSRKKSHKHKKKREKELRKKRKRKKTSGDLTTIEAAIDERGGNEIEKKAKKKKKRRLGIDVEAFNTSGSESYETHFQKSRHDPAIVSNKKEKKKKRKREGLSELPESTVKKHKQSLQSTQSEKHGGNDKCGGRHTTCNQRTDDRQVSLEQSMQKRSKHDNVVTQGNSLQSNTPLSRDESGKVSKKLDQKKKKRNKRKEDLMKNKTVNESVLNGSSDRTGVVNKSRVEPNMDKAKLREATKISDKIHETWKVSQKQLNQLKEEGIKVKKGRWSQQEMELLKTNMAQFLERHDLSNPNNLLFYSGLDAEEEKYWKHFNRENFFFKELGKGIQRPRHAIYQCAKRIYDETNYVGKYSENEIQELKRLHTMHGSDWVGIGRLMDRSARSVNRKYSKLLPGGDTVGQKGKWTDEELDRLKEAVHVVTKTPDEQPVYHDIYWPAVAQIVKTRNAEMCRQKWLDKLCWSMSANKTQKWTKDDDVKLITRLYDSGVTEECDVDWMDMKSAYETDYSPQWLRRKYSELKKNVPNYQQLNFEDIVDYLYRDFVKTREQLDTVSFSDETE